MPDNKSLIELLYRFQAAIRSKNSQVARILASSTIPLLEFQGSLAHLSERDLSFRFGLGPKTAAYVYRLFQGEEIESVAKDVLTRIVAPRRRGDSQVKDRGNWDGSWDNANRHYEGD